MRRLRGEVDLSELARLTPAIGVLAVWTVLMFKSGGFRASDWLPAGLVLLGLLIAAVLVNGRVLPPERPARLALGALAAYTLWCFASLLWSDARGDTLEAADLLLVVLLGAWALALAPWRPRTAWALLMAFSVAAAAACVVALLSALAASDLTSRFEDFRFSPPLDYPNTTAAFAFMAAIPALLQAARPDSSIPAKAFGQGLAMFLCGYALLPQSRGAVLGALAAITVLAISVSFRWRLVLHSAVLLAGLAAVAGPVGDVYSVAASTGKASDALASAATVLVAAALLSGLAGAALAYAQARIVLDQDARHRARLAGFAATGLAVLAIVAVGALKAGAISDELSDQWRSLKNPGVAYSGTTSAADNRLTSIDPLERYDYWRVSAGALLDAPLWGEGAGGFQHRYGLERRYPKVSQYPHNLALKVVGDTGIVGLALVGAFLVIVAAGLLRMRGTRSRTGRAVIAAPLAMLAYFAAHGMFDWLEAYPVLAGPALALPIVALVAMYRDPDDRAPARLGLPAVAAVTVGAVVVAAALASPWLSLRYRERAADTWRTAPAAAYVDLDRATAMNPLSPKAPMLQGVIALTRGELVPAERGFAEALEREEDWLAHFGLAIVAAAQGDMATARTRIEAAQRLDRLDPNLRAVSKRVLAGGELDTAALIRDVLVSPLFRTERVS